MGFTYQEVQDKVLGIAAELMGLPLEKVTPDSNLVRDFGADSLDAVEYKMELEDAFGIHISDDDVGRVVEGKTLGAVTKYLVEERGVGKE